MQKKTSLLILALVFALVLGAAAVAYSRLSSQVETDRLAAMPSAQPEETPADESPAVEVTDEPGEAQTVPEEQTVPDFIVYDKDGRAVSLSSFRGKPVVLNFWASWCPPCKAEMPDFQAAWEARGEDVHFLMVNLTDGGQETRQSADAFLATTGYTYPVYYDEDVNAATVYGVYSIPTTYFIAADGTGVAYASGAIDAETLQKGLDMLLPAG